LEYKTIQSIYLTKAFLLNLIFAIYI